MEMRCYRIEEIRAKIHQAIEPQEDHLTIVKRWTCLLFIRSGQNHLARHRQKMRLESNIGEGIGLEFAKSQRAVENREQWRDWF